MVVVGQDFRCGDDCPRARPACFDAAALGYDRREAKRYGLEIEKPYTSGEIVDAIRSAAEEKMIL